MNSASYFKILVLGADGFIGRNLALIFKKHEIFKFTRLINEIEKTEEFDLVINCIGCNRSENHSDFEESNVNVLKKIVRHFEDKKIKKLINLSSIHAGSDTHYGTTKEVGERFLRAYCFDNSIQFHNLRLPGVFGPAMKPNYNSVIATWCYNLVNKIPLVINQPENELQLTHILDLALVIENIINDQDYELKIYRHSLGSITSLISDFKQYEKNIKVYEPTSEFERHLFSCYLSYLEPSDTIVSLKKHGDKRGSFVEIFKKPFSGQISVSVTPPGAGKRGMHFHTSKIERFFVAQGEALITNKNIQTGKEVSLVLSANNPKTFITIPNWAHWVENISSVDLILVIWANEHFDPNHPDTIFYDH